MEVVGAYGNKEANQQSELLVNWITTMRSSLFSGIVPVKGIAVSRTSSVNVLQAARKSRMLKVSRFLDTHMSHI